MAPLSLPGSFVPGSGWEKGLGRFHPKTPTTYPAVLVLTGFAIAFVPGSNRGTA